MSELKKFTVGTEAIPNNKSGSVATASLHIFTAVVGAGVLALPQAVAWMGWVGGPLALIVFYVVSLMFSRLLSDVYEVNGVEHARYHHAVRHILTRGNSIAVSMFQLVNIFLITIAFTITGQAAMRQIAQLACDEGEDCFDVIWQLILIFGAAEVVLSQVRSLEEAWWISAVGSISAFPYILIAIVLSLVDAGNREGNVHGIEASDAGKAFGILNALGSISFAYAFSLILLEICDTLHQPPRATQKMKMACNIAITGSFLCYFLVGITGYVANGNDVPGLILLAYDSPKWALYIANAGLLVNMLTSYQVFAQPMFETLESYVKAWLMRREERRKQEEGPTGARVKAAPADATGGYAVEAAQPRAAAPPSPFDTHGTAPAAAAAAAPGLRHRGPGLGSPVGSGSLGLDRISLTPLEQRLSSHASGLHVLSSGLSGPMPSIDERAAAAPPGQGQMAPRASQESMMAAFSSGALTARMSRLSQTIAPYHVDTGLANEEVPMNDEGVFAPLWARLIVRSLYVGVVTLIAIIAPFFNAFVGLVGAITFFPLMVHWPLLMYLKVYTDVPRWRKTMYWSIWLVMLLVCGAATIAAVRNIIIGWDTYEIFGD